MLKSHHVYSYEDQEICIETNCLSCSLIMTNKMTTNFIVIIFVLAKLKLFTENV